jgi:3-deoxy-7-phosphoheptulonate synthase
MIIVLRPDATEEQIDRIIERLKKAGLEPFTSKGVERTVINVIGDERVIASQSLEVLPGVEKIMPVLKPYRLASRDFKEEDTIVEVVDVRIGGERIVVIAGPCSVEDEDQILRTAKEVKEAGASMIRGGAYKPRTSPYSFQGLGEEGLILLSKAREATGLPFVTEVMDPREVELVAKYADMLQIGARNMQNFVLLKEVGRYNKPVLLKRGISSTIMDLLMAAEYILAGGNPRVVLCERGIRTFETQTRNTLDLSSIPVLKELTHLPIIVDPSHGVGKWKWVPSMARAAVAAGCDGLIIEVHPDPEEALSDGDQSLLPFKFKELMAELKEISKAVGRRL